MENYGLCNSDGILVYIKKMVIWVTFQVIAKSNIFILFFDVSYVFWFLIGVTRCNSFLMISDSFLVFPSNSFVVQLFFFADTSVSGSRSM